jgi:hypothetical protein
MGEDDLARFQETIELTAAIPEIRARAIDEFVRTINQIADAIALRTGRRADDFEVRTIAGAIIGVIMSVTVPEHTETWLPVALLDVGDLFARIDRALAYLERGLPL